MTTNSYPRLAPRRVEAATWAAQRLLQSYQAELALEDGTAAHWQLSVIASRRAVDRRGLLVSTCFGLTGWLDYRALLLALTGIDVETAQTPSARIAFARYAIASLPASLYAALGDPIVQADSCEMPPDASIVVNLRCETASIRISMRLVIRASDLPAMIECGAWRPVPTAPPTWLVALPSRARVIAGETTLPFERFAHLQRADVLVLPASAFDVGGRGHIRIFDRLAEVQWSGDRHCFEVQRVSIESNESSVPPASCTAETAPAIAGADITTLPVRLSFSLGTLSLPMGEVAAIRAGTLLRLEGGLPPAVRIEANGVPLGHGELVDLDGRLAVEIVEWPRVASGPQSA